MASNIAVLLSVCLVGMVAKTSAQICPPGCCLIQGQCYPMLNTEPSCFETQQRVLGSTMTTIGQNSLTPYADLLAPTASFPSSTDPCDPVDSACPGNTNCRLDGVCYTMLGVGSICSGTQTCFCSSVGPNGAVTPTTNCVMNSPNCPSATMCYYNGRCYKMLMWGAIGSPSDPSVCVGDSPTSVACDNTNSRCPGALNCLLNGQCYNILGHGTICQSSQQCLCSGVGQLGPATGCYVDESMCPGAETCLYNGLCYKVIFPGAHCSNTEQCVCRATPAGTAPTNAKIETVQIGQAMRSLWQRFKCDVLTIDC